jgi:xanthine dehydrogenase accessory factor
VTHDHQIDLDVISAVLKQPAKFIGLIGSDTKWDRFQQRLLAAGYNVDLLSRVHCPIGLAIGGKAPREVAISIASQLLRIHYES